MDMESLACARYKAQTLFHNFDIFTWPSAIFHVQSNIYQVFDIETSTHFGVINKYYKC